MDGVPNYLDTDDDGDGIPDSQDKDDDNDGILDSQEDADGDGIPDDKGTSSQSLHRCQCDGVIDC